MGSNETEYLRTLGYRLRTNLLSARTGIDSLAPDPSSILADTDTDLLASALRNHKHLFNSFGDEELLARAKKNFPEECDEIARLAQDFCRHRFEILGSDIVEMGNEINWNIDFKSGKHWDENDLYLQNKIDARDKSDIKVPFELSRCNHFLTIAAGFRLTSDHSYAIEFENQVISWREQNPYRKSINWTNASETAYRCINWLLGYEIISHGWNFGDEFTSLFSQELYKGGVFISENLEQTGSGYNAHHYLEDLTGLLFLGQLFVDLPRGRDWRNFAINELEAELESQVNADGLHYESSLPYHAKVAELLLASYLLSRQAGFAFHECFGKKLQLMIENIVKFSGPDKLLLAFGDGDDGRLIKYVNCHPRDYRDLISIGSQLFPDSPYLEADDCIERAFALGSAIPVTKVANSLHAQNRSCYFRESGIAQLRSEDMVLNFLANEAGSGGIGGHKHNDLLSFTLDYKGAPFFVDPGTYAYTSDAEWRNHFRSTAQHNTIMIDGYEQNRFIEGLLFVLRPDSNPQIKLWKSDDVSDLVVAEHDGYMRLDQPVTHRRSVFLEKQEQLILIKDEIFGTGMHSCNLNFMTRDLSIEIISEGVVRLKRKKSANSLIFISCVLPAQLRVETAWYSDRYGVKEPILKLGASLQVEPPFSSLYAILAEKDDSLEATQDKIKSLRQLLGW